MHALFVGFENRVLLNPATLHGHAGDVEAEIPGDLNGIEVGGIGPFRNRLQRSTQRALDGFGLCLRIASARTRPGHPDKMPAGLPDHGVKHPSWNLFHVRPSLAKRSPQGIERNWKNAPVAQEDRVQVHSLTLPRAALPEAALGAFECTAGASVLTDDE